MKLPSLRPYQLAPFAACLLLSACGTPRAHREAVPTASRAAAFGTVGIEGEHLTVNGEKFLVVGIGHEIGSRRGEVPWDHKFRPDLLRADYERIKAAGFNTVRTWQPMTDQELDLAEEYGLWVIQGLWYDAQADFADPKFQQETLARVKKEVTRSARHPNILFYLLGNEPHGDAVYGSGIQHVKAFYRELAALGRKCDPKRPFSYSNCVMADFVAPDEWDLVAANVYPYSPTTISVALGYRAYLDELKEQFASGKPLLITEFGLAVSAAGDGRGYGGNTLEQQRDGLIQLCDDIYNAGAAGTCAFMWADGWWKHSDPKIHDDHAEEWYGFIDASLDDVGQPRPVYHALKEYNRAIRTAPRQGELFDATIPVEVWAPDAAGAQARMDDGEWMNLERDGSWWRGALDTRTARPGWHYVWTRGLGADGCAEGLKNSIVCVRDAAGNPKHLPTLSIEAAAAKMPADDRLKVTVLARDGDGKPLAGRKVQVERFLNTGWNEAGVEVTTGGDGRAVADLPPLNVSGIASVAAGMVYQDGIFRRRLGDYVHVELE